MLRQRILTGLVLAPVALGCVVFLPPTMFAVVFGLVIMLGAWEWANLAGFETPFVRTAYVSATVTVSCLVMYVPATLLLSVSIFWWAIVALMLWGYPASAWSCQGSPVKLLMGVLTLVPAWYAFYQLKLNDHSGVSCILLMSFVWAADVGAFFAGKNLGRYKLAERISPKKTIEGFVGGLLAALGVAVCVGLYFDFSFARRLGLLLLAIAVVLVSVLGDLFESLLKRERGIKDSSDILPGHGGVLDRIDSLTAAAPLFALALLASGG